MSSSSDQLEGYILNDSNEVVKVSMLAALEWLKTNFKDRIRVRYNEIHVPLPRNFPIKGEPKIIISTVFLLFDCGLNKKGKPLLFRTLMTCNMEGFDGDNVILHSASHEEAVFNHLDMLNSAQEKMAEFQILINKLF